VEIALEDVWFSYDGKTYVIESANVTFRGQGLYLVVGPNGSGKTTLLKIIALLYKPARGRVLVDGKSYWDLSSQERDAIRRDVVYVHDKPIVVRGSLEYNIRLGLELRGNKGYEVVEELLRRYKLEEFRGANVKNLSAGQRRLATILRALALKPRALILDEPLNHLDRARVELLVEDLQTLSKNSTVIVATHYITRELDSTAREVYEIIAGNVRRIR